MGYIQKRLSKKGGKGFPILRAVNLNLSIMAAEDQFFKYMNLKGQLTSLAVAESKRTGRTVKDLIANPTEDMIIQAQYEATRMSFNHNPEGLVGAVTNAVDKLYRELEKGGSFGRGAALGIRMTVMPFTRIVGNVLNAAIDWTPLGAIRAMQYASSNPDNLVNRQMDIWKNTDGTMRVSPYASRNVTRQITRAALGTIMMGLLMALANPWGSDDDDDRMGRISGEGPTDFEKKKQLMALGWTPYSIKIGKRWIPYLEWPISGALSVVGNLRDHYAWNQTMRTKDPFSMTAYLTLGIADSFFQRSFLSSLRGTVLAISQNNEKWLNRQLTGAALTPVSNNMARFIENMINDDVHAPATITDFIRTSIPFWDKSEVARAINVYGNGEVKRSPFARLVGVPAVGNETLVIVDKLGRRKNLADVTKKVLNSGLKIPATKAFEIKLATDKYVWLEGKDRERFQELRGLEMAMFISGNQERIKILAAEGKNDALAELLKGYATEATTEAKKSLVRERGDALIELGVYSKSRDSQGE
jgi:hypothetical protein